MTCNNGHTTCMGPMCTAANVPKRPKVGIAREREEIQGLIKTAGKYALRTDIKPTAITLHMWTARDVSDVLANLRSTQLPANWQFRITTLSDWDKSDYQVRVSYKRRKES